MLNWAARYFPILRVLRARIPEGQPILEVGSGSYGLAKFYRHPFVGCDVNFPDSPRRPMLPVLGSATHLPFQGASFDAVILSDVLEHIPPDHRREVIHEALRVARKLVVFGFPSGPSALRLDRRLLQDYSRLSRAVPGWLEEHMRYPYPDQDLFNGLEAEWKMESLSNERLWLHYWMSRLEIHFSWNLLFSLLLRYIPWIVERVLRGADGEPAYRKIVLMCRRERDGRVRGEAG
jgi:hypothetical protein